MDQFLNCVSGKLSYTGHSEKDLPIRTRPALQWAFEFRVSLKERVRNYTVKLTDHQF